MGSKATDRNRRIEVKRPRDPLGVTFAASGTDNSAAVVAWFLRMLDKRRPPAQG